MVTSTLRDLHAGIDPRMRRTTTSGKLLPTISASKSMQVLSQTRSKRLITLIKATTWMLFYVTGTLHWLLGNRYASPQRHGVQTVCFYLLVRETINLVSKSNYV